MIPYQLLHQISKFYNYTLIQLNNFSESLLTWIHMLLINSITITTSHFILKPEVRRFQSCYLIINVKCLTHFQGTTHLVHVYWYLTFYISSNYWSSVLPSRYSSVGLILSYRVPTPMDTSNSILFHTFLIPQKM